MNIISADYSDQSCKEVRWLEECMKYEWIKAKTPGIRYREHPTRKHGSVRKDRYYTIRYKLNGKTKEEALG